MEALTRAKQETGVSKHLHLTHLNEPTVVEFDHGQVASTLKLKGVSFEIATPEELNRYKRIKHQAISLLSEEFCVMEHTIRRKMNTRLEGDFPEAFTAQVDEKYRAKFSDFPMYANELYLTLIYRGLDSGKFGKALNFLETLKTRSMQSAKQAWREQAISKLKKVMNQLMAQLSVFKPVLLGARDEELGYSEVLAFYGNFVNGLEFIPFKKALYASPMFSGMKEGWKHQGPYPKGNLSNYLPQKRLFFGDSIEFLGRGNRSLFGAMISIKEYATETASVMLSPLLHLDAEFIYTNSFAVELNEVAQKKILRQLVRLENSGDPAISQQMQLGQCRDDLASGNLKVGYHHNSLMLLAKTTEQLQDVVQKAVKAYAEIGFSVVQETLGLEPAFWAQIPGNQKYVVRSSLITSQNFADFCPLHNYGTGYRDSNHLGSAVSLLETPSKTPLFFNFHAKGSGDKNDLTPGHTTIIGGNGSGKTVFMGFMDSQMSRYGGRSFFFDRDRGMEIYIRACGGTYARIHPDHPKESQFNPFCLDDTPKNRAFLKIWMAQLVKNENEEELPAEIDQSISACVDYAYEALSADHRTLSHITKILPLNFPRWDRLRKWLKGQGVRSEGDYAFLFDNADDQLSLSASKVGFDFTELLAQPKSVLTAVCMYLVYRIKQSLDGKPVSLYFDEGWQILDNDYWKHQLKQDLPTLRKLNAHIVLATQSPESVVNSALSAQFLDNCATHIFFCNGSANYDKHYRHFNLSLSEFEFLKHTPKERRLFLYKQAEEGVIAKLNLAGMEDELAVYSGNKSTVALLDQIREEVGDDPRKFLKVFHERRVVVEGRS
jgi:type IV secretion system protein VirB4